VDRQRAITAPWLGLELPAGINPAAGRDAEVTMIDRKRREKATN